MADLDLRIVVVGDEAYTEKEWELKQQRDQSSRAYRERPEIKAKRLQQRREWGERNREWLREYNREWMRKDRQKKRPVAVASLHDLRCTGPTRRTGCRCSKIPMYRGSR